MFIFPLGRITCSQGAINLGLMSGHITKMGSVYNITWMQIHGGQHFGGNIWGTFLAIEDGYFLFLTAKRQESPRADSTKHSKPKTLETLETLVKLLLCVLFAKMDAICWCHCCHGHSCWCQFTCCCRCGCGCFYCCWQEMVTGTSPLGV